MDTNPFAVQIYDNHQCVEQTVEGRIKMVKRFDAEQCAAAMAMPRLQKTVEHALRVRLHKLAKVAA